MCTYNATLVALVMALSLLTLNPGGCSAPTLNVSFQIYVEKAISNPDIVLLQETYTLNEKSPCCSPGHTRGSGELIIKNKKMPFVLSFPFGTTVPAAVTVSS